MHTILINNIVKDTHLAGVGSRTATGARAGGGRTGPTAGARGGGDRRTGRRRSANGAHRCVRRDDRRRPSTAGGAATGLWAAAGQWRQGDRRRRRRTGRETDGARVKMKRRAGRIRVKTPTAVYEAVGDKHYFRAPGVAVGHNLISDGLVGRRRR
jgi:hypothetical protein